MSTSSSSSSSSLSSSSYVTSLMHAASLGAHLIALPTARSPLLGPIDGASSPPKVVVQGLMPFKPQDACATIQKLQQFIKLSTVTAESMAYMITLSHVEMMGVCCDEWFTKTQTGDRIDIAFESSNIPIIDGHYRQALADAMLPIGNDHEEAKKHTVEVLQRIGDLQASWSPECMEFASRVCQSSLRTLIALGSMLHYMKGLIPRANAMIEALKKNKTSLPVHMELDYELFLSLKQVMLHSLISHLEYFQAGVDGNVSFLSFQTTYTRDMVLELEAELIEFTDILEERWPVLEKLIIQVRKNVNRIEKEKARTVASASATAAPLPKPVKYETAVSSSSSSTVIPNSHRRKEKKKTRPALAQLVQEESQSSSNSSESSESTEDAPDQSASSVTSNNESSTASTNNKRCKEIAELLKKQHVDWNSDRLRAAARNEWMREIDAREAQCAKIEAIRQRVNTLSTEDDLPVVHADPSGGYIKNTSGTTSDLPSGHAVNPTPTEKQLRKLAKKQTKAAAQKTMSLDAFNAQFRIEKDEEKTEGNKQKTKQANKK